MKMLTVTDTDIGGTAGFISLTHMNNIPFVNKLAGVCPFWNLSDVY
jgi:hypothetical protein